VGSAIPVKLKGESTVAIYVGQRVVYHVARLVFDYMSSHRRIEANQSLQKNAVNVRERAEPLAPHF